MRSFWVRSWQLPFGDGAVGIPSVVEHQGGQELRQLLMDHWDPIGVKDAPEAASEYDGYRADVLQLVRDGASADEIAGYLAGVAHDRMGLGEGAPSLYRSAGQEIVRWYPDSLARWQASHPAT